MPRINYFVPCSIPGCLKPMIARGWCRMHYYRWHKTGTTKLRIPTAEDRFWDQVNKDGPIHPVHGQCWIWTGAKIRSGYGHIGIDRKVVKAHRYSWMLHFGIIPPSKVICHHCDNPACINPRHLFIGTNADNVADRDTKSRQMKGERQHKAKLTEQAVREIRQRYVQDSSTDGSTALAKEYGVSHITILRAVNRHCWKHVT